MPFRDLAKQCYERILEHDLFGSAAELSYYFLFSIFPFLVFLVALAAYLPLTDSLNDALDRLARIMPAEAMDILRNNLKDLVGNQRPQLLSISVLVTIWSGSRGVAAVVKGLNTAYGVRDKRSYFRVQAVVIAMTLASALFLFVAFTLIVLGGKIGFYIADRLHTGHYYTILASWLRWPLGAAVVVVIAAVNYYMLPAVRLGIRQIALGSLIGTTLWLLCTWGFTVYTAHFGNYNTTYGSLGGVILLMTWLYLSGLSFLIGGETNAMLWQAQQAKKSAPKVPLKSELKAEPKTGKET